MLSLPLRKAHALLAMCLMCIGAGATEPAHKVGLGDFREGYEKADYESASQSLQLQRGSARLIDNRLPLGLPPLDVRLDPDQVALGRQLFFDRRLSANATISCAMCHIPEQGFTQNELKTPVGIEGRSVRRNAPSLYNVAYQKKLFHDGRGDSLEAQIWEPLLASNEMGNVSQEAVLVNLRSVEDYVEAFARIFTDGLTVTNLGAALAAYQRSLLSGDSPFDRWYFGKEAEAISEEARAGFEVFRRSGCVSCHSIADSPDKAGTLFTNQEYYNTGIGYQAVHAEPPKQVQLAPGVFVELAIEVELEDVEDEGLAEVSGRSEDKWLYRVPTLRNVALTAPYMHDGSLPTLEAVIDYYDEGGDRSAEGLDVRVQPLHLSLQDKINLVAFLRSLTGSNVDVLADDARSTLIGDRQGS